MALLIRPGADLWVPPPILGLNYKRNWGVNYERLGFSRRLGPKP